MIWNVPSIVGTVLKVNAPAVSVRLLKVIAELPFTVPALTKATLPAPPVNVPLLVKPPAAIFKVATADQLNVPLLTTLPTVAEPDAPLKVNAPVVFIISALVTVMAATVAVTVAVLPEFIVTVAMGVKVVAAAILILSFMVTAALAGGTAPPNHEVGTFQSVAPVWVIYPR